ncbi:hypothetical protein BSNK01_14130 [Bacillaceae bacterium]
MGEFLAEIAGRFGRKIVASRTIRLCDKRGIWWLNDGSGEYVLKKLNKATPFSLFVHRELERKKLPLPHIYTTTDGKLFVERKEGIYALFAFVKGTKPRKTPENWKLLTLSLARFHRRARRLPIPDSVETAAKWPSFDEWLKGKDRLIRFLEKQQDGPLFDGNEEFRALCKEMIKQGKRAMGICEKAPFDAYLREKQENRQLCHGDYGETNNSLIHKKNHIIIDLDETYYGLPLDDLRHFLSKSAAKPLLTRHLLPWYLSGCRSHAEKRVIQADLSFPYLFHYALKKRILRGKWAKKALVRLREAANYDRRRAEV